MDRPLVSVIITAYNSEKFIRKALRSISDQTYDNIEVCIHDDGSTDGTYVAAIRESVENIFPRGFKVRTSRSFVNEGVAIGRNKAIKEANGKYIAIQDSDDISFSYRIYDQVEFLESNPSIFCVSGGMELIDEDEKFIENVFQPQENIDIMNKIFLKNINAIFDPASMFQKKQFDLLSGYDTRYKYTPDLWLWVKSFKNGLSFHNLNKILVKYRKHRDSNCSRYLKEILLEHKEIMEKNKGFLSVKRY